MLRLWTYRKLHKPSPLELEVRYWLRATSRRRHSAPFAKRPAGFKRRQARKFKLQIQQEFVSNA